MTTITHEMDKDVTLGGRLLYLRTPNFHGEDVEQLQTALMALGFACGVVDGVFGAYTEGALRKFQLNMGLDADGIAGVDTYATLKRLNNAWKDKPLLEGRAYMGFARVADVLERHAICLFGTGPFTRKIASYMSNLALATNPLSKVMSADSLLVAPDETMVLAQLVLPCEQSDANVCRVSCDDMGKLSRRLSAALSQAQLQHDAGAPMRIAIEVPMPEDGMDDKALDRLAHHNAITVLDSFCLALS